MSATKTAIILRDSKDWPKWYIVTMAAALEQNLGPYVDPNKSKRDLAVLEEPSRPKVTDILPEFPTGRLPVGQTTTPSS